jgi:hypothetical protein
MILRRLTLCFVVALIATMAAFIPPAGAADVICPAGDA